MINELNQKCNPIDKEGLCGLQKKINENKTCKIYLSIQIFSQFFFNNNKYVLFA